MCRSLLLPVLGTILVSASLYAAELRSPDGRLVVTFEIKDAGGKKGIPTYRVAWKGKPILLESQLGLVLKGAPALQEKLELVKWTPSEHDSTWKPVAGERSEVRDRYRQAVAELREKGTGRLLNLVFRAYDEGVAFRYVVPKQDRLSKLTILRECSEFRFTADHPCWATYNAQGAYAKVPLSKVKHGCERPLPVEVAPDVYIALGEAALVDSARMKFAPLGKGKPALISHLDGNVTCALPFTSPWRFAMVAESPGRLLENNYFILNLNEPCALSDTSWIKPGKVLREVTLTTNGAKAAIDFCKKHHLQYIHFDAGWYGHEYSEKSDARTVTVDPKRSKGPLDLEGVIRYAKASGLGVIVYVNRRALERQLDEILPLYQKWGINGVKYGFVNVGSQKWTTWLHDAVRKAAEHRLVINVHDEYRPTGYSRTYPNLLTQEGIAGDEVKGRSNAQTLTILFSRYLAGAADNTICYFDPRVEALATHAYQLAKAVCLFSPLQYVYWYDRPAPAGSAGGTHQITEEPELEFFDRVPTVWDETRVLEGRIGESAVIARRSGKEWFVGIMQSGSARVFDVPLSFLPSGRAFTARIYRDDPATKTRCHVKIEDQAVNATTTLKVPVLKRGGAAIWIKPAEEK